MSAIQRARSGVPLDRRSTFPTVPGLPWWGVVCLAAGLTCVGFVVDTARGSELSSVFSTLYVLGCVLAVVFASNRAVFTAMVQPPLILFVGVPLAQMVVSDESSTALRDLAINVAYPLIDRFPVMLTATVLTALVGGLRLLLLSQRRAGPARSHDRARVARSGAREKKAAARRAAPSAPDAERRRRRARPASGPA
ncbi:DUF6542 domain-containing protein, partial [Rhodococcus sp. HNM0569]|uniref:DUF6542 domain-containing protein n=1 Tax=Rhodococcus sp. HNM0569 TaxID=2716340 RepID=UPI00197D14F6